MGSCCSKICGKKNLCTEDETKGLLHGSESKTSTKVGTEPCISPTSQDEEKGLEEETKPELNESVVTKQPSAVSAETPKPQSSYSETIAALHTEISPASEVNHNVLVETTQSSAEAECLAIETKTEVVQEIHSIAAEVLEVPQAEAEAPALIDDAGVSATNQDLKSAPVEKDTPVDETPVKDTPVDETPVKETPVEEEPLITHVEVEKNSSQLKPETFVSDEKETLQTGELPLNDITEIAVPKDTGDVLVTDTCSTEQDSHILACVTETSVTQVTDEEPASAAEVEEKLMKETQSEMTDLQQETCEASETQEYFEQVSSPVVDITNGLSPGVENGLVDSNNLGIRDKTHADVTAVEDVTQKEDAVQKPSEELSSKPSTCSDSRSATEAETSEVMNSVTSEEKKEKVVQQEQETEEVTHNGLNSTSASAASSPIEKSRSFDPTSDSIAVEATEVEGEVIALMEEKSLEPQDDAEPQPQEKEKEKQEEGPLTDEIKKHEEMEEEEVEKQDEGIKTQEERIEKQVEEMETQEEEKQKEATNTSQEHEEKEDTENSDTRKGEVIFSSEKVKVQLISVPSEGSVDEVLTLDESTDLYLGAEEIEMGASKDKPSKPVLELTIPGVESRSSLTPAVDILTYCEREWKGHTAKSALIRKGYSEMSHSFSAVKQVRGDNYCALRATLYQVLATSKNTPTWLHDEAFLSLPEMIETQEHLIGGWVFPPECTWGSEKDSVERMKYYLDLFKKKWQAASSCESPEERQSLCERVFQGGDDEYGLLEALKFLMLAKAIELHGNMVADQEVPVFCWLLFARDTSENPQTLLANHLSQIGFSGGVEQVEMFLLGYALQHTIQAFRLYMTDTVEFVTHYPDDHKHEWPCVCIITEDDRHYNIPVRRNTSKELTSP